MVIFTPTNSVMAIPERWSGSSYPHELSPSNYKPIHRYDLPAALGIFSYFTTQPTVSYSLQVSF